MRKVVKYFGYVVGGITAIAATMFLVACLQIVVKWFISPERAAVVAAQEAKAARLSEAADSSR